MSGAKTRRWRRAAAVSAMLLLAVTAAACGGDSGGDTTESKGEVDPSGILKFGYFLNTSAPMHFDPTLSRGASDNRRMPLVYGTLMQEQPDGTFEPWLAEKVTVVDPQTVEIKIRDGIDFTDGTPYDAEAVKAGLMRTRTQPVDATVQAGMDPGIRSLESVDVVDPLTVTAHLSEPQAGEFVVALAGRTGAIVSPTQVADDPASIDTAPVGAGPFTLTEFEPGKLISFRKNPDFFGAKDWPLGGVDFVDAPAGPQQVNGLISGSFDTANNLPVDSLNTLEKAGHFGTEPVISGVFDALLMNDQVPPLDDPRVRQAIQIGLDRDAYNELAYAGQAEPAYGYYPDGSPKLNPDLEDQLAYDQDQAKSLLAEAGADDITVDLYTVAQLGMLTQGQVIQDQLKKIGITVNVINTEDSYGVIASHKPGMLLTPAPSTGGLGTYYDQFSDSAPGNFAGTAKTDVMDLVNESAQYGPDDPQRAELLQEVGGLIADNAYVVPIVFTPSGAGWDTNRVGGTPEFGGNTGYFTFEHIYIKK